MYHCIPVALTLYLNAYDFLFWKQKTFLLKRFTYIFLLTYILNAPKINDLYMTKKKKKSTLKGK